MNDAEFWGIIETARDAAGDDIEGRADTLAKELEALPLDAVQSFQLTYDACLERANRWPLWGAAYFLLGGCTDIDFRYFLDWLISEGRQVYEQALIDPDSLAARAEADCCQLDAFGYAAQDVYESKGGEELQRNFPVESARPFGSQWDEDSLRRKFPRLAERFDA